MTNEQKVKRKIVVNGPCYKNELRIYERETLDKIKGFRLARAKWLASVDDTQKTFTTDKEAMGESNLYNGRCLCLRKIRLKTTLLRFHYKTLRPLRYWTLKRRLQDYDLFNDIIESQASEKKETKPQTSKIDLLGEICSSGQIWKKEEQDECEKEASKLRGRAAQKRKKKECKEMRAKGPCKTAIKKLKAARIREGLIESCKCEDGREVTVVIKGICLCEKNNLNNLNLDKVCKEYNRTKPHAKNALVRDRNLTKETPKQTELPKQTKETDTSNKNEENVQKENGKAGDLHPADSLEVLKKKMEATNKFEGKRRSNTDINDVRRTREPEDEKIVTFKNEELLKRDGHVRNLQTASEMTMYRKFSDQSSTMADSGTQKKTVTSPSGSFEGVQKFVKQQAMQEINKPVQLPQTESLNNLFVNPDEIIEGKGDNKRDGKLKENTLRELDPAKYNSLEIHKKRLGQNPPEREELVKAKWKEDLSDNSKPIDTVKKLKVKLNDKPIIIPRKVYPGEHGTHEHPKPIPAPRGSLETLNKYKDKDKDTGQRSTSQKSVKPPVSKSKTKAAVSSIQTEVVQQKRDDASMTTLYRNQTTWKSEMGLTQEELDRIKEAEIQRKTPNKGKSTVTISAPQNKNRIT